MNDTENLEIYEIPTEDSSPKGKSSFLFPKMLISFAIFINKYHKFIFYALLPDTTGKI